MNKKEDPLKHLKKVFVDRVPTRKEAWNALINAFPEMNGYVAHHMVSFFIDQLEKDPPRSYSAQDVLKWDRLDVAQKIADEEMKDSHIKFLEDTFKDQNPDREEVITALISNYPTISGAALRAVVKVYMGE